MKTGTLGLCVFLFIVLICLLGVAVGSSRKGKCNSSSNKEGFYLPGDLAGYLNKDLGAKIPKAYYYPLAERPTEDMLKQGLDPSCGCAKKPWKPYDWTEQPCPCC